VYLINEIFFVSPLSLTGQAKIDKPYLLATISTLVHFFKKIELLVIKMPNKKPFCCKSLSKIFFVIFIAAIKTSFYSYCPPTQFLFPISHGPEYFSLPKRETEACLKREPTTKINKPHVQGSASNNINANTLF
jgi:hypothetical protein